MKHRNGALSLLGAAAISTLAFPAFANTATQQTGTQSATISGNNNQVIQVINQVNISHPGLGRGLGNNNRRVQSGTVQDSYQGVSIDGSGNTVYQETNQINQQRTAGRPGQNSPNAGRYGDDDDDDDDDKRGQGRGSQRDRDDDDDDDD